MQLKIQRSQRMGGLTGSTVFFCLDIRADYTSEEQDNIRKYRLAGQGLYNSRAATRHLDAAGAHLDQSQSGDLKHRAGGIIKGAASLALSRLHLSVTIESIGKGHHIECKDMEELLEAEDTLRTACKNLTRYLEVASTFNGSELVVSYANGEEEVHISQNAPPLLEKSSGEAGSTGAPDAYYAVATTGPAVAAVRDFPPLFDILVEALRERLARSGITLSREDVVVIYVGLAVAVLILLLMIR
jgi:hypothetical protein